MSATMQQLSTSRSRTSTPTRAITSPLSTRSSPLIPPAAHTFEPLVKAVLRHRLLYNIFGYSLVFSWIQIAAWVMWSVGGGDGVVKELGVVVVGATLLTPVLPTTLALAGLNWVIVSLPVIVLRKKYLTATRTSASSPSKILHSALSKPSTWPTLGVYTVMGILVAGSHAWMARVYQVEDPRLTFFVRSKKHPYYLNGRFLFLVLSQVVIFHGFHLRNILLDRYVYCWSITAAAPSSPLAGQRWPFRLRDLANTSVILALFACICTCCSALVFALTRAVLPLFFKLPFMAYILRPLATHFLRGSWTVFLPFFHFSLLIRTFFLSLSSLFALEFADTLFDSFVAQPILVARGTADPALTLVSGITSSNTIFKYVAYFELNQLATDSSPAGSAHRTTSLFGDTKHTPNLWSQFVRESLLILGQDYQLFLGRGKMQTSPPIPTGTGGPPNAAASTSLPSSAPLQQQTPGTPTRLIRTEKSIYKTPTTRSPVVAMMDTLAADGPFAKAAEAGEKVMHIPELFRSVESVVRPVAERAPVPEGKTGGVTAKVAGGLVSWLRGCGMMGKDDFIGRYVPVWAREALERTVGWWRRERVNKVAEACLPRKELDALVIDVLTHLTCASLTEDRYGVVQRDIPQILEALLSFLSAVEKYQMEISGLYTPPSPDQQQHLSPKELGEMERLRMEVEKAGEVLGAVSEALKGGVVRIVRTFKDRLLAFRFPPRTASKLQGFWDYR